MRCQKRTDTTCGNSLVGQWEIERRQKAHRAALSDVKPTLDIKRPPPSQPHLTLYGRDYAVKKKATTEAAFADLKMIQSIARTMTRPVKLPDRSGPMSLNTDARKAEIHRIMHENHRLLDHIESSKPFCRTSELVREHTDKHAYVINLSHSKRLYGEYDDHIRRIKDDQRMRYDSQKRETAKRKQLSLQKKGPGSMSMPALMPMEARSPQQPLGPMARSSQAASSSSAGQPQGASDSASASQLPKARSAERVSVVHFQPEEGEQTDFSPVKQPKTPHPTRGTRGSKEFPTEPEVATQLQFGDEASVEQPAQEVDDAEEVPVPAAPEPEEPAAEEPAAAAPQAEAEAAAPEASEEAPAKQEDSYDDDFAEVSGGADAEAAEQ